MRRKREIDPNAAEAFVNCLLKGKVPPRGLASRLIAKPTRIWDGEVPVVRTLISVEVTYYDGRDSDRVQLNELKNKELQLAGREKRGFAGAVSEDRAFVLCATTAQLYRDELKNMRVSPLPSQRDHDELTEGMRIELGGEFNACTFSWENGAPQQWKPLEQFAMKLVIAFNDLCSENPA